MGWKEINKKDDNAFPENPNFDYKTFYKFAKKYGFTHYSEGPKHVSMEDYMQTKSDDGRSSLDKGFPPHYENTIFLKGPRRHVLLAGQPYLYKDEVEADLNAWNVEGTYDVKVYDKNQGWYDPTQDRICIFLIILKTVNYKEAIKMIDQIIGSPGKPPKHPLGAADIEMRLDRIKRIEGMNVRSRGSVIAAVETAKAQMNAGELSAPLLRSIQKIIMDPANYDKEL